jgi:hypothetical protein
MKINSKKNHTFSTMFITTLLNIMFSHCGAEMLWA